MSTSGASAAALVMRAREVGVIVGESDGSEDRHVTARLDGSLER